ncbi:MAG: hypothetical protein L6R37_000145 [Teloschistes peruensis]|nr:MAG: hypothetical protein L6R37_000145 [Teloschistes peruensis]
MNAWTPQKQEIHDLAFQNRAAFWQNQQTILQYKLARLYRECRQYRSIIFGIPESDISNEKIEARTDNYLPPTFGELDGPLERRRREREEVTEVEMKAKNDRRLLRGMEMGVESLGVEVEFLEKEVGEMRRKIFQEEEGAGEGAESEGGVGVGEVIDLCDDGADAGSESTLTKGKGKGKAKAKDFIHERGTRGDFSGDSNIDAEMDDIDLEDSSDLSDLSIPSDLSDLDIGPGYNEVSPASLGKTIKRKGKVMGLGRGNSTEEESLMVGSSRDFEMDEEMPGLEMVEAHGHGDPFRGRPEKPTSSSQIRRNMTLRARNSSLGVAVDDNDDDSIPALDLTPTKGPRLRINGPKPRRRHSTLSIVDLGGSSPEKDILEPLDRKLMSQEQVGGSSQPSKADLERVDAIIEEAMAKVNEFLKVQANQLESGEVGPLDQGSKSQEQAGDSNGSLKAQAGQQEQPAGTVEADMAKVADAESKAPEIEMDDSILFARVKDTGA